MPLELRQLRHVLALAQHGSLGRAAAALDMTQPALSRSLKLIEGEVGNALFDRTSSGVTPTDHGRLLIPRARELVEAADELDRDVLHRRAGGADYLKVGAGPYPAETIVPSALARFLPEDGFVRVRVLVRGDWDELLRQVRARKLDFFVAEFSTLVDEHDLDIQRMTPHQVYFLARRGHPLAAKTVFRPEEIFAFPFVAFSRYPPRALRPMLAANRPGKGRLNALPFPAIECSGVAAAKRIVANSDAIAPFTLACVAEEVERGSLTVLGTEPWSYAHYAVVSLKGQVQTAAAARFRSCLQEAEAALAGVESRLAQTLLPASRTGPSN